MSLKTESWVVYLKTLHGSLGTVRAVCEQVEWDALEASRPGHHQLIQSGIATEGEAERLARGTSGSTPRRGNQR